MTKTKLFAWQPDGHGQYSFFVAAENEGKARVAVDKYIEAHLGERDGEHLCGYSILGWGTDSYKLTVLDVGKVITNENE